MGKVKASDASGVLAACVSEAQDLKDEQAAALKAAVAEDKARQAEAQAAYTRAMSAYLNGDTGASLETVSAAAKIAFGTGSGAKSAYAELAYESDMAETYAELSSGEPGEYRLYEEAKAEAFAAYATTVTKLYAARHAALKASREAEWDLRRLELREKEAAWSSMVDATVGKALTAWKEGVDKLDASYQAWEKSFQERIPGEGRTLERGLPRFRAEEAGLGGGPGAQGRAGGKRRDPGRGGHERRDDVSRPELRVGHERRRD